MLDMSRTKLHSIFLIIGICISGCGGGGGGSEPTVSANNNQTQVVASPVKGVFIDSPVNGLEYQGTPSGRSGITGESGVNGEFTVAAGDTVTFRLGNLSLGSTTILAGLPVNTVVLLFDSLIVTPASLAPNNTLPWHPQAIRIAQLLQSLDSDKNPINGITIATEVRNRFRDGSVNADSLQLALNDGQNFDTVLGGMIQTLTSGNANRGPNQIVSFINAENELTIASRMIISLNFVWPTTGAPVPFISARPTGGGPTKQIALDGTRSFDPDNQPLTYLWSINFQPSGANATLSSPAFPTSTLSIPTSGNFTIELKVTDSTGLSSTELFDISIEGTTTFLRSRGINRGQ